MPDFSLYLVTPQPQRPDRSHPDVVQAALEGGAGCIQLRDRTLSDRALWEVARRLRRLTQDYGATLLVNDRADIALAAEADGVHLGQDDLPVEESRRLMGPGAIIGVSVGNLEEAIAAEARGASYVSVGSVFATGSKPDAGKPIGAGAIAAIEHEVGIPVLAIGGINCDNIGAVIEAGADGVAVVSAVADAPNMAAAARALRQLIQEARRRMDR
jgi:thiamine-phosphate diphosphorylase